MLGLANQVEEEADEFLISSASCFVKQCAVDGVFDLCEGWGEVGSDVLVGADEKG